ncbi:unnamed protein product [Bursaphelenchus xylophilus]|uniref:(pine wood nematode) hypothetical protein n=1 Tax=Bursaphelenchus xylophilus TaxID=6326 RepID=A0A1I7S0V3_BURXY|nr:unnamed protein product [Bursaphelenchus xylophilus]CAG9088112.1 unnamed protein product [Bursaphelenchus xylophilus]
MLGEDSLTLLFIAMFYGIGAISLLASVKFVGHPQDGEESIDQEEEKEDHIHNYVPSKFHKLDSVESLEVLKEKEENSRITVMPLRLLEAESNLSRSRISGSSDSSSSLSPQIHCNFSHSSV